MPTTIFTPQMLRNGTRAVPEIPAGGGGGFTNTYSLDFDGVNDYVSMGNVLNLANDGSDAISISLWLKTTLSSLGYLVSKQTGFTDGYGVFMLPTGEIAFYLGSSTSSARIYAYTQNTFNDGDWHNVVITYDGSQNVSGLNIYVNNTSQALTVVTNNTPNNVSNIANFAIGMRNGDAYPYLDYIDEVSVFNSELTSENITAIYNGGTPTDLTSLSPIAWYRMGDNGSYKSPQWLIPNNENKDKFSNYSFEFDGMDDYVDCGDSDTFSFGNGSTDSPFSISAWIKMDDASQFRIASKYTNTDREYVFATDSSDRLSFVLYDLSSGGRIQRKYNTALTSFQGQWINVVATYDGNSLSSGILLYLNGTRVDDLDGNLGSYTAMENTTQPFEIGRSNLTLFANGKIDELSVFNSELSASDITDIYNGGEPTTLPSGAVAHYRMGEDATFVYDVNPDGTWTIPDQVGSNDGTSNNQMADSARVGSAPSSSNNAVSFNMDEVDRVEDVPS